MKEYIERQKVIDGINDLFWDDTTDWEPGEIILMCHDMIAKIHTADVRPVAHGHNTGNARIFECSECGYGFMDIFLTNERDYPIDPNYCPNCGADMREETDAIRIKEV